MPKRENRDNFHSHDTSWREIGRKVDVFIAALRDNFEPGKPLPLEQLRIIFDSIEKENRPSSFRESIDSASLRGELTPVSIHGTRLYKLNSKN